MTVRIKFLPLLLLFTFVGSCKNEAPKVSNDEVEIDEYAEFKTKPDYVLHPTKDRKEYFDAYDKTLKQWGVPYEELYITTSKGIAHVVMSGPRNAVPVVLMHGMGASSTMWYPNAKALAQEYRLFAIDLIIEPGKSYKTADFKDISEVTKWYQEILWALKLDSYHLIGTSRGGWMATDLALNSQRNIRSLILLSPVQTFIWIPPTTGLLKNLTNVFYSEERKVERMMETLSVDPEEISDKYLDQYRLARESDTVKKFLMQMKPFPNKKLKTLKMPVYVLVGDEDMFNNKRTIKLVEKHLSYGKGEIIKNSGHFVSVDQADLVNKKMLNYMRRIDKHRK